MICNADCEPKENNVKEIKKLKTLKRTPLAVILTVLVFMGNGCASYWYQEGKTFDECKQARAECRKELLKRSDLTGFGDYEVKFMKACMKQKGYRLVRADKLPMHAKREAPETSLHYRAKGVAGTLAEEK